MGVLSVDEVTSAPQVCDWPREPPGVKDVGGNDVQVMVTLAGPVVPYHPRCWKDIQGLLFKCLFRTQCNVRKILIKTILQKKCNHTAPAPYLLPVFPPLFTFSSCHFPYGCQNFPFGGWLC